MSSEVTENVSLREGARRDNMADLVELLFYYPWPPITTNNEWQNTKIYESSLDVL